MRPALPLLLGLVASAAHGQTPDTTAAPVEADSITVRALTGAQGGAPPTPRRMTTVPLPSGRGVFYYRAGTPGGVRIRSRRLPPAPPPSSATSARTTEEPPVVERERQQALTGGSTRLDLALLEERLLRAIDQRLAALDPGYRPPLTVPGPPQAPVIVLPAAPGVPSDPVSDPAPTAEPPPVPETTVAQPDEPAALANPLVEEIERAILDTGLFRTTRVHFEFGEVGLLPVSEETLRAVVAVLRRYPALRVEVGGHTDWVSSAAFNLRLSQRRAEAVRDYLIGAGVDADRVTAVGYGESRPVASNETETGRALNRRVEFVVLNPEAAERERRTVREAEPDDLRQLIRDELERLRDADDQ